ncbi:MAG: phenylalanine--tRNA ligase subunit beta [Candidatus Omnitrophota bacterium]
MKVSYSWLKDYVDVKLDPKKLAHLLTMTGVNVASCQNVGNDHIFEFEITANRPDCLSVLGIAREVAAVLGKKLKTPKDLQKNIKINNKVHKETSFPVLVNDPDLCCRYSARLIKDVEVGPSPEWLKERILSVGLRPINNIVDITNFVLLETGQPMHAFDSDKIRSSIIVRRARKGEMIITIDNIARTCSEDALVIADEDGAIALAGIMGGLTTEVNRMTKSILLESANFDPASIRRTSRALGMSSESSYRFERKIDNDMVVKASNRATALIRSIAGGTPGRLLDVGKKTAYSKTINFDIAKAMSTLGISMGSGKIAAILKPLGFSVEIKKRNAKVTVPSFREDVKSDIDLTEEVARAYGYEKISPTIPQIVGNTRVKDVEGLILERIGRVLTRLGLSEIITYSLISKGRIEGMGIPEEELVTIRNPLSIDQEMMRPTMLPGMLTTVSYNLNRKAKKLSLFEIGKVYREKGDFYTEQPVLSISLTGIKSEDWRGGGVEFDFFDIKGIFERLLQELGILKFSFKDDAIKGLDGNISSSVMLDGKSIASIGQIDKEMSARYDIEKRVMYGELYIQRVNDKLALGKRYKPFGRYPSVMRDISIVADQGVRSQEIMELIEAAGKELVKKISLVSCYQGKQIPDGKKGLLYRIECRSDKRTLKDSEVDELNVSIKKVLSEKLAITFR